jgi:DNA polymerase-3 subunit gamma/tau
VTKPADNYITFARKYRPIDFSELYGQEVLIKILSYTILNNRISQGYLLTGIRGVGKTTSARIIAKTINCTSLVVEGANIKPCGICQNCQNFSKNNHPDIIEIDAASKTSVDDVRKIIESSDYKPLIGKYTIFIIDEVHMLSKGAFNALLKILEEPPAHIIFIFATTEPQKIPLTVISRCQRYDLKRLTFNEILQLIQGIAEQEQLRIDNSALKIIAARSDGSARDAISILDQATSLGADELITPQMINQILGLVDTVSIVKFVEYIIQGNVAEAIELVNSLYNNSANLESFISLVADFIAYLSKVKLLPNYQQQIYQSANNEVQNILTKISLCQLSVIWQIFSKAIIEMKTSHNQLIEAEMLAIKAIYSQTLPSPEELIAIGNDKIEREPLDPLALVNNIQITDFLNYLHLHNEMEIYYLLLNQVELKSFVANNMEIAGNELNAKTQEQIGKLLLAMTREKWHVSITKQQKIYTLKEQLINKVKSGQDWEMLTKHFPNITISDILLQN